MIEMFAVWRRLIKRVLCRLKYKKKLNLTKTKSSGKKTIPAKKTKINTKLLEKL
jgi:hypothetical protein